jgi:uncharacterized protein (DUF2147 family)
MKKVFPLIFALFISVFAMAQKATDNFSGQWKTADGVIIEITQAHSAFVGKPQGKNVVVLKDLVFTDGKWRGTLSNPQKNTTANCEAYLEGNRIRFIAKKGMMKKEIIWSKVD